MMPLPALRSSQEPPTAFSAAFSRPAAGTATSPVRDAAWACPRCGVELDAACDPLTASCAGLASGFGPALVIHRLEQAGRTLLAMRGPSPWPAGYRCMMPEVVREQIEAYGWTAESSRSALPDARQISAMEATYTWLGLIPKHNVVLRRLVASRSLVHPLSGRHLVPWRALARLVRANHMAVRRWHGQGIAAIVAGLAA